MIKAFITIAVIVVVGLGGWQIYEYWQKVDNEKEAEQKQAAASAIDPATLRGVPYELQESLNSAQQHGAVSLGSWLKIYGPKIQDPRKAWIQLDYVVMITRDNPQEAKQLYGEVKDRILPDSPVWPRIQSMEKTYE